MSNYNEYNDYCDHIENVMKSRSERGNYNYKRHVLDEMELRTKEILGRGLNDKKVAHDLVIDEYDERFILNGYEEYLKDLKEKWLLKKFPLFSGLLMLLSVIIYLAIGFIFNVWHPTWLIIEGCATAVVIGAMFVAVSFLDRRKKSYFIMRMLVAGSVMVASQFFFLLLRIGFHIENAYLAFIAAVAFMFIGDLLLATATKQRLVIINYLITIPVVSVFVYVLLGLTGVLAWNPGWMLIPVSVVVSFIVLWGFIRYNRRFMYKPEVDEQW
ncbi:MAG: hypothetical protein Q3968_06030 [Clostridiaceae bacterium]|nr:hypothetical protein [Clostridiaceae bacterium]